MDAALLLREVGQQLRDAQLERQGQVPDSAKGRSKTDRPFAPYTSAGLKTGSRQHRYRCRAVVTGALMIFLNASMKRSISSAVPTDTRRCCVIGGNGRPTSTPSLRKA